MSDPSELALRSTRAIVDLDALAGNIRAFRRIVPEPVRLMAVVKANAYGHGAVMVARTVLAGGASHLGVATVAEGVQLRAAGVSAPILVLGPVAASEVRQAVCHDLALAVGSADLIDDVSAASHHKTSPAVARLHLKVDTGMRRFGCMPAEVSSLVKRIVSDPLLDLEGIFTHFACADEANERPTIAQRAEFDASLAKIAADFDLGKVIRHVANSAATLRSRDYDYDMVRLGIAIYGAAPSADVPLVDGMRPVMSLVSRVARVIQLAAGDRVSYGGTYVATADERAALVPIGYADGYPRGLSNRAWMGVAGARAPVRGRVCMDQTVIGLPPGRAIDVGNDVVVVGSARMGAPSWDGLARLSGTIAYEMVTGIATRVPRVFVQGSMVVATECLGELRAADDVL